MATLTIETTHEFFATVFNSCIRRAYADIKSAVIISDRFPHLVAMNCCQLCFVHFKSLYHLFWPSAKRPRLFENGYNPIQHAAVKLSGSWLLLSAHYQDWIVKCSDPSTSDDDSVVGFINILWKNDENSIKQTVYKHAYVWNWSLNVHWARNIV